MNFTAGEIALLLTSYAMGCCCAGYYLVRLRTGADVRTHGSGSAGATNVGRKLGAAAFALTFVADLSKGALAVWCGNYFGLQPEKVVLAMIAVVAGHIWPVQLHFRGGKGIATAIGAILVFDYRLALVGLLLAGLGYAVLRRMTIAGLVAVAVSPAAMAGFGASYTVTAGLVVLALIILIAHRTNFRDAREAMRSAIRSKRSRAPGV